MAVPCSSYWKVSSEEDYDYLQFYIDGVPMDEISGEVGWHQKQYNITGSGSHHLFWQYIKDGSEGIGSDRGYVDYLQWTGDTEPQGWQEITYTYDHSGRRIEKTIDDDQTTRYLYDGDNVIAEYDGNNNLLLKYIHGASVDMPICMIDVADSNAVYYYHFDGLGSVVALSDSAGDTVQTYEYSVYGLVAAEDPNHPNPYMFTGRRLDFETGLYYYRARYYNQYIGRFMQTDPAGYDADINLYRYCMNNPLNMIDPYGVIPIPPPPPTWPGEDPCCYDEEGFDECKEWAIIQYRNCMDRQMDIRDSELRVAFRRYQIRMKLCKEYKSPNLRALCEYTTTTVYHTETGLIWDMYAGRVIGCNILKQIDIAVCWSKYCFTKPGGTN